jgi:hypothetical protein
MVILAKLGSIWKNLVLINQTCLFMLNLAGLGKNDKI